MTAQMGAAGVDIGSLEETLPEEAAAEDVPVAEAADAASTETTAEA
jgi:hypothetical protein